MAEPQGQEAASPGPVVLWAGFDALAPRDVRLAQEAARLGPVHARVWADGLFESLVGRAPRFPERERRFLATALRYVATTGVAHSPAAATRRVHGGSPSAVVANADIGCLPGGSAAFAPGRRDVPWWALPPSALAGFPPIEPEPPTGRPRVVVTGCFDWLHSGHVEFFAAAAALGELYVVVGSDRNVRLLKGPGHPLRCQEERVYMVQAVRSVHRALVSTGSGWMDAEPEIAHIRPDLYVVNDDGDQPEKREFCRTHRIEYAVLRRRPHRGLPARTSTALRGF